MLAIIAEWMVQFFVIGLDFSRVPMVGTFSKLRNRRSDHFPIGKNQAGVLGTLVFNYAFVVTVPSWVNEKVPRVLLLALMPIPSAATSL